MAGTRPVRVVFAARELYRVVGAEGEVAAVPAGRLRYDAPASSSAETDDGLFSVGDWAVTDSPLGDSSSSLRLVARLPRRGRLARKVPGERTRVQVVGANVDTVFIVMGLDGDFNPRRLERFVAMAADGGVAPVVVLTKTDLRRNSVESDAPEDATDQADDVDTLRWRAQDAAPGVPVHAVATPHGEGLEPLRAYLEPGRTVALVGSSGAGKSTLVNALSGAEVMRTGAVRAGDDRGRHTTTHRQLLRLPSGALLIDNPGIRELQLWTDDGDAGLASAFDEVDALAPSCRFRDCRHIDEPGCAVLAAVDVGALASERLDAWHKLQRELEHLELRQDDAERRRRERGFGKMIREAVSVKRRSRR
ncbi:MAG: ribosome small subunit-dependent GTPase A [Acidobacteriota bacterium]